MSIVEMLRSDKATRNAGDSVAKCQDVELLTVQGKKAFNCVCNSNARN
jgi:hypothetical protein